MLLHPFDSQKNEALNHAFTKHAPKNIVFSKTFTLFDRLAFVIIIDSLGYEGCLKRLLADVFKKQDNVPSNVLLGWAKREDSFKDYILERQRSKKEKIRRTAEKKLKLMQQRVENSEAKRKGDYYGRGLALRSQVSQATVPAETGNKAETGDAATANEAAIPVRVGRRNIPTKCRCGMSDHLRITYGKCELNPKNIARAKADEEARKAKEDTNNMECEPTRVVEEVINTTHA